MAPLNRQKIKKILPRSGQLINFGPEGSDQESVSRLVDTNAPHSWHEGGLDYFLEIDLSYHTFFFADRRFVSENADEVVSASGEDTKS